jgi:hypothetical protein
MAKTILVPILYLLSGVMIAPGAALAYFIRSVNAATRQGNLLKFVFFLLIRMYQTMDWVIFIVAPALVGWLVLAFVAKYRWVGASGMGLVAVATLAAFVATWGFVRTLTDGGFLTVFAVLGLGICLWITWDAFAQS